MLDYQKPAGGLVVGIFYSSIRGKNDKYFRCHDVYLIDGVYGR